ncbi:FAD-binding monooxygenase, partial [Penicillium macrosclerotiorum]|uniref:FAD-binding monooxygenase n=1 Tax=Penicillium macrosclerotiorum TaxID=303699 RepID=UPI0025493AEF
SDWASVDVIALESGGKGISETHGLLYIYVNPQKIPRTVYHDCGAVDKSGLGLWGREMPARPTSMIQSELHKHPTPSFDGMVHGTAEDQEVMANPPPKILVIGCGPVGLFAAHLLGRQGIPTLIIDKHADRRGQPKAHALNPRSLEIFRQAGLDVPYLRTISNDPRHVDVVLFVDKFYGWEYRNLTYERQFDDVKDLTPEPLLNIPQPAVEEYLLSEGVEWLSAEQSPRDKVISKLLDRAIQQEFSVETAYLLACDGGRSTLRNKFNIGFHSIDGGPGSEKHHATVHFRAELPGEAKRHPVLQYASSWGACIYSLRRG